MNAPLVRKRMQLIEMGVLDGEENTPPLAALEFRAGSERLRLRVTPEEARELVLYNRYDLYVEIQPAKGAP